MDLENIDLLLKRIQYETQRLCEGSAKRLHKARGDASQKEMSRESYVEGIARCRRTLTKIQNRRSWTDY